MVKLDLFLSAENWIMNGLSCFFASNIWGWHFDPSLKKDVHFRGPVHRVDSGLTDITKTWGILGVLGWVTWLASGDFSPIFTPIPDGETV